MKPKKTKQGTPATKGKRRRPVEIRWDPESEKRLHERLKSPEGQRALHELMGIIARAAVDEMMQEMEAESPDPNRAK